ncbi:MAG TPA: tryptophan--tRNA ligase, partial [Acidimicrobiales bacterium]|nr:tryptophan--tRNA ligase [Acidimicrobiales bacterium]
PEELAAGYDSYGQLKADAVEAVINALLPLQERYRELSADPGAVQAALAEGAAKATDVAAATLGRATAAVGLLKA